MKNYKVWVAIITVLFIINSVVLAMVWFRKAPVKDALQVRPGMEPKDVLISALALTPKQQNLYTVMRTKHMQATRELNNANHLLRDSLFANIQKPVADTSLINSLSAKIADNQQQLEKVTLYHFRDFRTILTPQQQTKFDGLINQVLGMMAGQGRPPQGNNRQMGPPQDLPARGGDKTHGMPPGRDQKGNHHFPPPNGAPPPGPDGWPPPPGSGPPPGGGPPNGPPPPTQ